MWDEYPYEEDSSWSWYSCLARSIITDEIVEERWPIFAQSFDAAIDVYLLLLKIKYEAVT